MIIQQNLTKNTVQNKIFEINNSMLKKNSRYKEAACEQAKIAQKTPHTNTEFIFLFKKLFFLPKITQSIGCQTCN